MYRGSKIGVAVAAFNEENFISGVIASMPDYVDRIYVVNDASVDDTAFVLERLGNPRVRIITHARNQGAGAARVSAIRAALEDGMEAIVTVDGDGQMDPSIMHTLLDPIVEGLADYTKGDRFSDARNRRGMPFSRVFGTRILNWATRVASGYRHVGDAQDGYTAIRAFALRRLDMARLNRSRYAYENDILIQLHTFGATVVNVPHPARYGSEKSTLRIVPFANQVGVDLISGYLWRLGRERGAAIVDGHRRHLPHQDAAPSVLTLRETPASDLIARP